MKNLKQWLEDHPCINMACIESEANIPAKTLVHFKNGRRDLNKDHLEKLIPVLNKYGFNNQ